MSDPQLADVARVCNRYPDIEVNFDVTGGETVTAGEPVQINVFMERTLPEGQDLAPVHCPRYLSACYFTMLLSAAVLCDMPGHSLLVTLACLHSMWLLVMIHSSLSRLQWAKYHVVWSLCLRQQQHNCSGHLRSPASRTAIGVPVLHSRAGCMYTLEMCDVVDACPTC